MKILAKTVNKFLLPALVLAAFPALAVGPAPDVVDRIMDNLKQARSDLQYSDVKLSPIPGLYEVRVTGGPTLYVSEDGEFFIAGDLFSIEPGRFVNIQEQARAKERAKLLARVDKKDQIIFSPAGETKTYVNVFTDVDCGFCQKLHQEIDQITAKGIEVRYLAYPRAGVNSPAADKLATAWCAEDPQATLTALKSGEAVAMAVCDDNPVADQYMLGGKVGVNGTPNIVTEDGIVIGGYMTADDMAKKLGISN